MKKLIIYYLTSGILFFPCILFAQENNRKDAEDTQCDREITVTQEGKVYVKVWEQNSPQNEAVVKTYESIQDAENDAVFNAYHSNEVETLKGDLSFDKNDCSYQSIKIQCPESVAQNGEAKISGILPHKPRYRFIDEESSINKAQKNRLDVNHIRYFPDAETGNLSYQLSLKYRNALELELMDSLSNVVYQKKYPQNSDHIVDEIDMSELSSGRYTLMFRQKNKSMTKSLWIE